MFFSSSGSANEFIGGSYFYYVGQTELDGATSGCRQGFPKSFGRRLRTVHQRFRTPKPGTSHGGAPVGAWNYSLHGSWSAAVHRVQSSRDRAFSDWWRTRISERSVQNNGDRWAQQYYRIISYKSHCVWRMRPVFWLCDNNNNNQERRG